MANLVEETPQLTGAATHHVFLIAEVDSRFGTGDRVGESIADRTNFRRDRSSSLAIRGIEILVSGRGDRRGDSGGVLDGESPGEEGTGGEFAGAGRSGVSGAAIEVCDQDSIHDRAEGWIARDLDLQDVFAGEGGGSGQDRDDARQASGATQGVGIGIEAREGGAGDRQGVDETPSLAAAGGVEPSSAEQIVGVCEDPIARATNEDPTTPARRGAGRDDHGSVVRVHGSRFLNFFFGPLVFRACLALASSSFSAYMRAIRSLVLPTPVFLVVFATGFAVRSI